MSPKQKKMLIRIIIAGVLYAALLIWSTTYFYEDLIEDNLPEPILYFVPFIIAGYDIVIKAFKNIAHGQIFDENFLMLIASIGAYGIGEYSEAVAVIIFYQVGELFQSYAVGKSRKSIADMMDICPEYANVEKEDGSTEEIDPDDVETGSIIVIKPGERIPIDSVVLSGESYVDTSALTGESVPRRAAEGDTVYSGSVNGNGLLRCRTLKAYEDSAVAKILELVENASSRKSKHENFIHRFAKYYTPIVTIAALMLAVIPSIITGDWAEWIKRACTFLVISCPCALVISVPMGFFSGIGAASSIGVLVKGSNYLEAVADIKTICFDKTGTLTKGEFKVNGIYPEGVSEEKLLETAYKAEKNSTHPVAGAVCRAYKERLGDKAVDSISAADGNADAVSDSFEELPGQGIAAVCNKKEILAGNDKLMKLKKVDYVHSDHSGTVVYVAENGKFIGSILISDSIKTESIDALVNLKSNGVTKTALLTGDKKEQADKIYRELKSSARSSHPAFTGELIDEIASDLYPQDKVAAVERFIRELSGRGKVAFAGDGINDSPVLSRADIGIAMGSLGSDAAIEAADVVIMDDNPAKIASIMKISRKTLRIVKENIVFALGVKVLVLILGALGIASMWAAVFADVGVAVIAILNSMRALKADK
ncbi:MAG: heavy metal translocating P-type ATPase [Lachnospiraceae bacterium]|nr:heavy metal translocating P-type ATPase [Lachnospiraceae bacterium]MBR3580655.1 heavy metal translocating P-type ATPase [Lachnospiraceae bacterium]MBR4541720.1 heavy metal translocating P-type ATPase [Lachnospiraceae bacterium]